MVALLALLACLDEFEDAAEKVKFPADEVLAQWSKKGEVHQKLVRTITDRKEWAKAFETVQKKLGIGPGKVDIDVLLFESDGQQLAQSKGTCGFGVVWFNMKLLVPTQKKMDEIDLEMKEGKLAAWIIPPRRLDAVITHELTHVMTGGDNERWVAEGLATYAAADDSFLYEFNRRGGRVDTLDRPLSEDDAYSRGLSFFRWMEKQHGADTVKKVAFRLSTGLEKTGVVVADILEAPWEQVLLREKAWSTEYLATFKTAR
ncbi:MAG TPA: hypothetical protein VEN81_12450 [Planctomycetota bacterium]|nr:hypothetical protein [Planctomycetota bacterium]